MIIRCLTCDRHFDDEFRNVNCLHKTVLTNGQHYFESWLGDKPPARGFYSKTFVAGGMSEHDAYQEWYRKNKVKV